MSCTVLLVVWVMILAGRESLVHAAKEWGPRAYVAYRSGVVTIKVKMPDAKPTRCSWPLNRKYKTLLILKRFRAREA